MLLLPVTSVTGGIVFLGETLTLKIALGGLLALWAMAANRFFIGMVRIQV